MSYDPFDPPPDHQSARDLAAALGKLDALDRQLIVSRYLHDETRADLARRLSLPYAELAKRETLALTRLHTLYELEWVNRRPDADPVRTHHLGGRRFKREPPWRARAAGRGSDLSEVGNKTKP